MARRTPMSLVIAGKEYAFGATVRFPWMAAATYAHDRLCQCSGFFMSYLRGIHWETKEDM